MDKICLQCEKTFKVQKHRIESAKFCSINCRIESQSTTKNVQRIREKRNCLCCNSIFEVTPSRKTKYCSKECYWSYRNKNPEIKIQSNQTDNRLEKKCINCETIYKVHKYRKNVKYCSILCHNDYRRKTIICPTCEKDFTTPNFKGSKYCSVECAGKGVLKRKSKFSEDVFRFLKKYYNVEDEKYENINGRKYFGDILLNDYNIIIECNGDYWHCNPKIYDETYFNEKVRKTAKEIWMYDKIKEDNFKSIGYIVIILWEYDWNNEIEFFNNLKEKIEYEIHKNKEY